MVIMGPKKKFKRPAKDTDTTAETDEMEREKLPKEILIIAQEVKIVQALACNDVNKRNRQLKKLRKWLQLRSQSSFPFTEEDFRRIWKGLYYIMWMSDKPLVQEDLAEQLGKLVECFEGNLEACVQFYGAFLQTMYQEWFGVDQWRIDKFLMLVRRMLRHMLRVLKAHHWSNESVQMLMYTLQQTVLAESVSAIGLTMHMLDIFFQELAKVSEGDISADVVGAFVRPFVGFFANNQDGHLRKHCRSRVFFHLLYQSSLGREYSEKYNAWKSMGFPTASIDDLVKEEDDGEESADEDEVEDTEAAPKGAGLLDPRAGNVDVEMPELPLDARHVIEELESILMQHQFNTKRRKILRKLVQLFKIYQSGRFPLGIRKIDRFLPEEEEPVLEEKIEELDNLENELYGTTRKLKQLNKRKRRKLLKSLNYDAMDESNFDETIEKALPQEYLKQRQKRGGKGALMTGWLEEELDALDLAPKKAKRNKPPKWSKKQKKQAASADEPAKKVAKMETPKAAKTPKEKVVNGDGNAPIESGATAASGEWDQPLAAGEVEYFIPSRKLQLKRATGSLVRNPLHASNTPKSALKATVNGTPQTPNSEKRVKIMLKHNTAQNPSEYIRQIKSSPNVPYDASKKPGKGLLKPNALPSPINPFYKKKIGLHLMNDTL